MNTIVFNGTAIEAVAPVKIDDIRISPIQYSPVVRPRAIQFGADFVRMRGGERTITITFALQIENRIARRDALDALSEWARSDAEYEMQIADNPGKVLYCVCTEKPSPSVRQWWENKLRFVFTCFNNPYWTDAATKAVACGTQFNARGDAPPLMRIERTLSGAASNQSYSDGTNTMTFSTIPAGNLVIDLNKQTAAVGSTSIMQYYAPAGAFIPAKTGVQTITGTGTIKYRERWE